MFINHFISWITDTAIITFTTTILFPNEDNGDCRLFIPGDGSLSYSLLYTNPCTSIFSTASNSGGSLYIVMLDDFATRGSYSPVHLYHTSYFGALTIQCIALGHNYLLLGGSLRFPRSSRVSFHWVMHFFYGETLCLWGTKLPIPTKLRLFWVGSWFSPVPFIRITSSMKIGVATPLVILSNQKNFCLFCSLSL